MRKLALAGAALPLLFLAGCGAAAATGTAPASQSSGPAQPGGESLAVGDCLHLTPSGPAEYRKVDCSDFSRFLVLGEIPREENNAAEMGCEAAFPFSDPSLGSPVTDHIESGDKTFCLTLSRSQAVGG